jgi:hydrogenase large subunit
MASVRCLDDALGFDGFGDGATEIPQQGRIMRNLIEGADMVMSHILHFYHLAALDYINTDSTAISGQSPWYPKDNTADMVGAPLASILVGHYVTALNIRRETHRMIAYADGKHPCTPALIPGGVTNIVRSNLASNMQAILGTSASPSVTSIRSFIDNVYIPDVVTVAKAFSGDLLVGNPADGVGRGTKKFLAYGSFPDGTGSLFITGGFLDATGPVGGWAGSTQPLDTNNIKEYIRYSYYNEGGGAYDGLHPTVGVTQPQYGKTGAYSWLKAPRYVVGSTKHVCEVGPLARVMVNYCAGVEPWVSTVNNFITGTLGLGLVAGLTNMPSVLGRHAARALECKAIADTMAASWIPALTVTTTAAETRTYRHRNLPRFPATGEGLTEAPRGALGHWIKVDGKKISNYQCVVPSTWNMSPKDTDGQPSTLELALSGTLVSDDAAGRTRVGRIIRSFDPCIACAVHIVSPDKKTISKFEVVPNR